MAKIGRTSSSSGQWRPRLRHEKNFLSVAGDTSDAIVLEANSSNMHTEEAPEETSEEVILLHELPLKTWITWMRWWHLTAKALPLVLKKKVFGVVGAYLRKETH